MEVVARVTRERARDAAAVRVVAPDRVPGRWDRSRVEGIVANLLAVAAKRGGKLVEVRITPEEHGGRIEVHRSGAESDAVAPHGQPAAEYEELEVEYGSRAGSPRPTVASSGSCAFRTSACGSRWTSLAERALGRGDVAGRPFGSS